MPSPALSSGSINLVHRMPVPREPPSSAAWCSGAAVTAEATRVPRSCSLRLVCNSPGLEETGASAPASTRQPTSIDGDDGAVHVIGGGRREKYGSTADVRGLPPATRWNTAQNLAVAGFVGPQGSGV